MSAEKTKLEQYEAKIVELQAALDRARTVKQSTIVITQNAKSILHLSLEKELTATVEDYAEELKGYIVGISEEENPTTAIDHAKVIRVTAPFKEFCRNAIIQHIRSLRK